MTDFKGLYDIRDGKETDKNFILATFLRGLYYGDSWFSLIPKDIFMDNYKHIAQAIITNPNVVIKIACLPDDNDVILGYSILSADYLTIHWVYCKSAWRKKGIGKSLLPSRPTTITHLSATGKELMSKFKDAIFNPFAI
jgi:hypothetical protein